MVVCERVGVCGDARTFPLLRHVLMFWLVLFLFLFLSVRHTCKGTCWDRMSNNQHGAQNELVEYGAEAPSQVVDQ